MLTFDLFTARSNLLPHAFIWAIYIYIGSIEVACRLTVAKIILIGNLRWPTSCLCILYLPKGKSDLVETGGRHWRDMEIQNC